MALAEHRHANLAGALAVLEAGEDTVGFRYVWHDGHDGFDWFAGEEQSLHGALIAR